MAAKGKPAPPSPPSSSASESGSYATSSDEEEHQEAQQPPPPLKKPVPAKPPPAAVANEVSDSSESEDSDSGSSDESEEASDDSDSPPKPAAVSKPTVGTPKGKPTPADKPKSLPASDSVAEKRKRQQAEDAAEEEAASKGPSAKKLFQRVWTEEDEIAVLKGMIDFQAKHGGADPASDAFYEFVRRALHVEFTKSQLSDKMRRLRKKYETNLRRGKNGAGPSFAKSHEQAAFELSKKLWDGKKAAISTSEGRANDYASDNVTAINVGIPGVLPEATGAPVYPRLREAISLLEGEGNNLLAGPLSSRVIELLKPAKAKALEEQWNKHFMAGVKYMLERAELKRDLLKSISKALASE